MGGDQQEITNIFNICLSGDTGTCIPVNVEGKDCLALIDTGAGCSFMSAVHYHTLGSPPLEPMPIGVRL